ncbi:MAG: response regulator [Deltaproteobacteria bacterium]|nr:response regulator [Deltaproteobacteria bacterium]
MSGKRILVVDDSRSVREQLDATLSHAGYEIVEAENGLEGRKKILSDGSIVLVISDVHMPHMNGIEMLESIHEQIEAGLIVLMLTTEGHPAMLKKAKAAGAKGWLVKPFKADQIVATVNKLVS